ncbi:MAG: hypothetical protein RL563_2698 [Pseudomonadota bacterium]|jgi:hypothetical protein
MADVEQNLIDCIVKLEHLAEQPFYDSDAYAKWCETIALSLREALELLQHQ